MEMAHLIRLANVPSPSISVYLYIHKMHILHFDKCPQGGLQNKSSSLMLRLLVKCISCLQPLPLGYIQ